MKKYKDEIILGIISIICTLLFTGIPVGNNILEILTLIIFILGLLLTVYFGIIKKNSKNTIILSIIYFIILLLLVGFIELQYNNFILLAIGFMPGLVISLSGITIINNNKDKYNIKVSLILNIIALVLSIISLLLIIPNGGFIIR